MEGRPLDDQPGTSWQPDPDSRPDTTGDGTNDAPAFETAPDDASDERALVARALHRDAGAFDMLIRRYQDIAFRTAYVISGGAAEAEDAAQEAFVKAYLALPRFRAGSPFRPWLLTIVANEARNRRRSAGRRVALALRAGTDRASGEAAPSPEVAVLAGEQRSELLAAVERLRDEDRTVIACRYFLGLSEAETAAALNCPTGTVKSRLSRALGRLRSDASIRSAVSEVRGG